MYILLGFDLKKMIFDLLIYHFRFPSMILIIVGRRCGLRKRNEKAGR